MYPFANLFNLNNITSKKLRDNMIVPAEYAKDKNYYALDANGDSVYSKSSQYNEYNLIRQNTLQMIEEAKEDTFHSSDSYFMIDSSINRDMLYFSDNEVIKCDASLLTYYLPKIIITGRMKYLNQYSIVIPLLSIFREEPRIIVFKEFYINEEGRLVLGWFGLVDIYKPFNKNNPSLIGSYYITNSMDISNVEVRHGSRMHRTTPPPYQFTIKTTPTELGGDSYPTQNIIEI